MHVETPDREYQIAIPKPVSDSTVVDLAKHPTDYLHATDAMQRRLSSVSTKSMER